MYPQSLQTHSPCQYLAALASSSAFWAADFLLPNTMFRLVELWVGTDTRVDERAAPGVVNALAPPKRRTKERMAAITDFILLFVRVSKCVLARERGDTWYDRSIVASYNPAACCSSIGLASERTRQGWFQLSVASCWRQKLAPV